MAGRGGVVRSEDTLRAAGTGSRRGVLIVAALGTRPAEASAPWLAERLLGAGALDVPSDRNLAEIRHRLKTLRLADFRSGDLVYIDGWALTHTEVQLMALIAMCSNADAC